MSPSNSEIPCLVCPYIKKWVGVVIIIRRGLVVLVVVVVGILAGFNPITPPLYHSISALRACVQRDGTRTKRARQRVTFVPVAKCLPLTLKQASLTTIVWVLSQDISHTKGRKSRALQVSTNHWPCRRIARFVLAANFSAYPGRRLVNRHP